MLKLGMNYFPGDASVPAANDLIFSSVEYSCYLCKPLQSHFVFPTGKLQTSQAHD